MKKFQSLSAHRKLYQQNQLEQKQATESNGFRDVVKGIAAISIWVLLFVCCLWIKSIGYWGYLKFAIPVYLAASLLSLIHPKIRHFICSTLPAAIEEVFDIYQEKMDWVVYFWLALFYGGILYFILCAPYGVLCHVGLRPCGK